MTVAAELAKYSHRMEYFVTIEGIGWPLVDVWYDSLDFQYSIAVWATDDLDGDLATQLGCDVYYGLQLPGSISESIDPRTASHSPPGLTFEIVDHDDWWLANCTPRKVGSSTTLSADLAWTDNDVYLTDGTNFSSAANVWVGGRELIKLGTKVLVAGVEYHYTTSYRGRQGTKRGSTLRQPEDAFLGFWPAGTSVQTIAWWWWNRRVALWAHVPGEAGSASQLVWYGRLRNITNPKAGNAWRFECTGDVIDYSNRIRRAIDWRVTSMRRDGAHSARAGTGMSNDVDTVAAAKGYKRLLEFGVPTGVVHGGDGYGYYEVANAYQWRTEPGGLAGMVSAWDTAILGAGGIVQAADVGTEDNILSSYVLINGTAYLMERQEDWNSNTLPYRIIAEIVGSAGESRVGPAAEDGRHVGVIDLSISPDSKARFLLDNLHLGYQRGRYVINKQYSRNPIDVALMHMLSCDSERKLADTAAGCTATVINTATTIGWADDLIGLGLFVMEGAQKYESRQITDNTATTVTVERGFSGAPAAAVEVQVRNSIYDVLPLGWGLGIDARAVDIESFEAIREGPLVGCQLGLYMLGVQDEIDLWELVRDNILKPYGVGVYFDTTTRKITARYFGVTPEDGVFDDFTAIARTDIMDPGDLNYSFSNPVSMVKLTVRTAETRIAGVREGPAPEYMGAGGGTTSANPVAVNSENPVPSFLDGKTTVVRVRSDEANLAFFESELDTIDITALLNTDGADLDGLVTRLIGMLGEYSVPPPVWTTKLDIDLYNSLRLGTYVVINWNTPDAPANPYTGTRGWTDVVGRVISRGYPFKNSLAFPCTIELLVANTVGRITPAAIVTSKGNDGFGDYFVCSTTETFVADPDDDKDWWYFAVGDVLEHRDANGAVKGGWANRGISAFGATQESTPEASGDTRIYLDGAIGSVVAAGDYITFADWSNATSRMENYSAWADSNGLLNAVDSAKQYA